MNYTRITLGTMTNTPILPKLKTDATLHFHSNRLNSPREQIVGGIAVR